MRTWQKHPTRRGTDNSARQARSRERQSKQAETNTVRARPKVSGARDHWGQAVPARSWTLVGAMSDISCAPNCTGQFCQRVGNAEHKMEKGREQKRKKKTGHRDRRPVQGRPRPRGGARSERPRPPATPRRTKTEEGRAEDDPRPPTYSSRA